MVGQSEPALYVRTYGEVRDILMERARHARNPMDYVPAAEAHAVLDRLGTLDRERWAQAFSAAAEPHFAAGLAAEDAGDRESARREYRAAFGLFRVARYPAPNSPAKRLAYRRSQEAYFKAAALAEPGVARVAMPYVGAQASGATIVGYLHRPLRAGTLPVVVQWGGIDSFKEDRRPEPYLAAGLAVLAVDMPGVGDAPIPGSETGEELWNGIFDWIAAEPGLDARRIAVVGASTGGYWAAKLAHTHRDRIAAAVTHGGPAHFAFAPDWIARAARGEYPFELAETLASAFGRTTAAEWLDYAPRLSLLDQGVLDRPSAPLLCVNGVDDSIFPIEDMYLLLRHGGAKSARFFPGGHMGHDPSLFPTIVTWIARELSRI
ncbi:MAG TPA: alpha/beta fold hydrolase [Stellaceae bacterium]|nr:alpha/beta fold hydrolase [Stellaceae bacterium]